jgi:alpha-1,2-mannosyltransferase
MQVSLLNFIQYNVVGGGESSLYGVEAWPFYFINGTLNFGVAFPAALMLAPIALLGAMHAASARITARTAWAVAPLYVWIAAITALPHKEERFLYVVYPQVRLLVTCNNALRGTFAFEHAQLLCMRQNSWDARLLFSMHSTVRA